MKDCLFCKIVNHEIPAERLYEDSQWICIRDIHPQAPVHLLVIPKRHLRSLAEAYPQGIAESKEDSPSSLAAQLLEVGTRIAWERGLLPQGFRSVINTHEGGGQSVFHLHLHLLGGEKLKETFA